MADSAIALDDSRYEELFQIEGSAERSGSGVVDDPYPIWAELRA